MRTATCNIVEENRERPAKWGELSARSKVGSKEGTASAYFSAGAESET
jgi:hypothetical protein